ncbi:response regulator, partial [Candidatus Halobeggiatoa sp. HSG11]|nr:response regulator [Candidatus Halobeggiatoa sp. HSG11]
DNINKVTAHISEHPDTKLSVDNNIDELADIINHFNNLNNSYQKISTKENTLHELLDTTLIGLCLWKLDGAVKFVNPAFAKMIGHSIESALNLNYWQDVTIEESIENEQKQLLKLKIGERYGPLEREYQHKDGYYVPIRVSALIIKKGEELYAWSYVENISGEKWKNAELISSKEKAEKANLAKSQFLANMSHELRTPMNTIVGYTEMLEEEIRECKKPRLLQDVKSIHAAAKHLLNLIDGILDISKIEAGKMQLYAERFDLKVMLKNTISTLHPLIENKANAIKMVFDDDLGEIYTDLTKVRQIVFNLLSNASKFTEQGIITLKVHKYREQKKDFINIQVIDEGIGMTGEQLDGLFQVFTQADASISRDYGGTGLGLAISKHFVKMLGGKIIVDSKFGKGSRFNVNIPAYLDLVKPNDTDNIPIRIPDMPVESGLLLVIDDDGTVRELLDAYLSKIGYRVVGAASGPEGLKLAKKLRPDAITLDVMMPGMDGWEVLSELKADSTLSHIPVIMLTMTDDQDIGYSLGAAEYLTKPISRTQLIEVLRKYHTEDDNRTVMVVEDDNTTREMMVRMLHKGGWKVIEAENGEVALRRLEQAIPNLILLDLMMPQVDGFEFIIQLRQHKTCSAIPVVVLTAKDITPEDRLWLTNRVDTVFQKGSYTRDELFTELRQLLVGTVKSNGKSVVK